MGHSGHSRHCHSHWTEVSVPGSRPPTESKAQIRQSNLLERVNVSKSVLYSDGNASWKSLAAEMQLKHKAVPRQLKVFSAPNDVAKNSSILSSVSGTQVLDRTWKSLKDWLPRLVPKPLRESMLNETIELLVYQWSWRRSQDITDAGDFLRKLQALVRKSYRDK